MIERKIRLTDTEEVKDFVRAAGKCDFDIERPFQVLCKR